jgi:hypothetical protein
VASADARAFEQQQQHARHQPWRRGRLPRDGQRPAPGITRSDREGVDAQLKEHSPDAVDISDLNAAQEAAIQAEAERRIVELERKRLGLNPEHPKETEAADLLASGQDAAEARRDDAGEVGGGGRVGSPAAL